MRCLPNISEVVLVVKHQFATIGLMSPITITEYCAHKGKAISLSSTEQNPNLFTADNAKFIHHFRYRDVDCTVLVPYKGEGLQRFWNKLLRYVRAEKKREDEMWEHGVDECIWLDWTEKKSCS